MSAPNFHTCAAEGCGRRVPEHLLMCIDHWRMVPAPLRREVLVTWKARRMGLGLLPAQRLAAVQAHEVAKQHAVTAVADKQRARAANTNDLFG